MNTIESNLRVSISKINFEDIPMILDPETNEFETKHYIRKPGPFSDIYYNSNDLPINYYVLHISENIKYYFENRNDNLTFENIITILISDFNFYTSSTIEEMQMDAILIGSWLCPNQRNGWYYFDDNYDIIATFLDKYEIVSRINVYKDELLRKCAMMMLNPCRIIRIMNTYNIKFEDLNFEDL